MNKIDARTGFWRSCLSFSAALTSCLSMGSAEKKKRLKDRRKLNSSS